MSSYILDKAYVTDEPINAYRVVLYGRNGSITLPGDSGNNIAGITVHSQQIAGGHVAVRKAGIAFAKAAKAINAGDPLTYNPKGWVEPITAYMTGNVPCIGFAETTVEKGGNVEVFISIHERQAEYASLT